MPQHDTLKSGADNTGKSVPPKKRNTARYIILAAAAFILLAFAAVFVAPKHIARHLIADDLDRLGISHTGVETLQIDLWDQEVSIGPFNFRRGEGKAGGFVRIGAKINLFDLFSRKLVLNRAFVDGINLDVVRDSGGKIKINGVNPSVFLEESVAQAAPASEAAQWGGRLEEFELRNSRLVLRQQGAGDLDITVERVTLSGFDTTDRDSFGSFSINGRVNGIGFTGTGAARLFSPDIAVRLESTIKDAAIAKIERYTGPLKIIKGGGSLDAGLKHDVVLHKDGAITYAGDGAVTLKDADLTFPGLGGGKLASARLTYEVKTNLAADQTIRSLLIDSKADLTSLNFSKSSPDREIYTADRADFETKLDMKQTSATDMDVRGSMSGGGEAMSFRNGAGLSAKAAGARFDNKQFHISIRDNADYSDTGADSSYAISGLQIAGPGFSLDLQDFGATVDRNLYTNERTRLENVAIRLTGLDVKSEQGSVSVSAIKSGLSELSLSGDGAAMTVGTKGTADVSGVTMTAGWPAGEATSKAALETIRLVIGGFHAGFQSADSIKFGGDITVGGATASVNKGKTAKLSWDSLSAKDLSITGQSAVSAGNVTLDGLVADVSKKFLDAVTTDGAAPDPGNQKETALTIGALTVNAPAKLRYRDQSVTPQATTDILIEQLSIKDISTVDAATRSTIKLASKINGFTELNLHGSGSLFSTNGTGEAKGAVKNLQISRFSPYTKPLLGLHIDDGQLTASFAGKMAQGKLDSALDLTVARLKFGNLSAEESKRFKDKIGVPVETAVSLLRDSKGVINLNIPVGGTLNEPEFDFSGAVNKAVGGLLKSVFPPTLLLGLVQSAGATLGGDSIAMIPFSAGQADLGPAGRDAVDNFVTLLNQRPELKLRVCGVATPVDRQALEAKQPKNAPVSPGAGNPPPASSAPKPPTAADREKALINKLNALALARTVTVRKVLSGRNAAAGSRVAECRARWAPADKAQPRAEVKF